ncbi:MAG: tetratricopeptide repeat protein [Victivallales bacterium]|nr:tetratricopeptide repeat protein [Victivallales bacterium]
MKTVLVFCLVALPLLCGLVATAEEKPVAAKVYRTRQLGDRAFADGIYELAVKFYETYRQEAAADGNLSAQIDASECLIATHVRSGNALAAGEVFNRMATSFATTISGDEILRNRMSYWDGNIQISSGDLTKAADTLSKLLNRLEENSELYLQTLDALGTTQARALQWEKAEKTYALLEFAGKNSKWQMDAIRKRLLALLMSDNYTRARTIIALLPEDKSSYGKIISTLILIREGKTTEAADSYADIRKDAIGADPLWFMLSTAMADAYLQQKDFAKALLILNDAVLFASSEFDRQQTLVKIINTAVATNDMKAAVATGEKFLKNYPNSHISNNIRLRLATLYADGQKTDDALQVYATLIADKNAELSAKLEAARSAAKILIILKRYQEAQEMFDFIVSSAKDEKTRGEGVYGLAELLYIQSKYEEAAAAFEKTAITFKDWREKSLFMQVKSLMNTQKHKETVAKIQHFLTEYSSGEYVAEVSFLYALALKNSMQGQQAEEQFGKFAESYPDHVYAPRALFEKGMIALGNGKDSESIESYSQLIGKYPTHILIPNALYRRMHINFFNASYENAIEDVNTLLRDHPTSQFAFHGGMLLADHYASSKEYDNALGLLRSMLVGSAGDDRAAPRLVYEMANVYFKAGRDTEAMQALDELSEKYPDSAEVNDGLFLRGEIFSRQGEFDKAIPFFKRAAEGRPGSLLETAALGRAGDCYFALGWKTPDGTNYLQASKFYSQVIEGKHLPMIFRDQALYKLGRCEELLGDNGKALSKFHEAIYNHELDREEGIAIAQNSVWFVKSVLAAARLYLAKNNPESAEAAIMLYKTLVNLNIPPVEDHKRKIKEISERFKLKE